MPLYIFRCTVCHTRQEHFVTMGVQETQCRECRGVAQRDGVNRPSIHTFKEYRPRLPTGEYAPRVSLEQDRSLRFVNEDRPFVYDALRQDTSSW